MLLRDLLARAGRAMTAAVAAGAATVLLDRLVGPGIDLKWCVALVAGAAGLGAAWSFAGAWRRRPRSLDGALRVDERFRLDDRLSSALQLDAGVDPDAMVAVALQDAESAARATSPALAAPVRLDNWWVAWPAIAAAGLALAWVTPLRLLADPRRDQAVAAQHAELVAASEDLRSAEQALREAASNTGRGVADLAPPESLKTLERLKEQLAGARDPREPGASPDPADDARSAAADTLQTAADRLHEDAERALRDAEDTSAALSRLESPPETASAAQRLRDALRGANPEQAGREAEALERSAPELSEQQRREESQRLEAIARELQAIAQAQRSQAEEPREAQRELQRQGLAPEQVRSIERQPTPDQAADELRKQGIDPETAQKLADKLVKERAERDAREKSAERSNSLSEALRRAAEEMRNAGSNQPAQSPDQKPAPNTAPPPSAQRPGEPPRADKPSDANPGQPRQPDATGPSGNAPQPQRPSQGAAPQQQQPSKPGAERPQPTRSNDPGSQGTPAPANTPPQGRPADAKPSPSDGQGKSPGQDPAHQNKPQPGQPPGGARPAPGGESPQQNPPQAAEPQQDQGQPGAQPGQPSGSPQSSGADQPGSTPGDSHPQSPRPTAGESQGHSGAGPGAGAGHSQGKPDRSPMQALKDQLKQWGDSRKRGEQMLDDSRKLKEQADRIVRSMSPQQRKELEELARGRLAESPVALPSGAAPLDLRQQTPRASEPGSAPPEKLAEVDNPRAPAPPRDAVGTRPMQPTPQDSLRAAQKAIEDKQLPARYRNVERYFKRAAETAPRQPAPKDAPPVKDAKDAGG